MIPTKGMVSYRLIITLGLAAVGAVALVPLAFTLIPKISEKLGTRNPDENLVILYRENFDEMTGTVPDGWKEKNWGNTPVKPVDKPAKGGKSLKISAWGCGSYIYRKLPELDSTLVIEVDIYNSDDRWNPRGHDNRAVVRLTSENSCLDGRGPAPAIISCRKNKNIYYMGCKSNDGSDKFKWKPERWYRLRTRITKIISKTDGKPFYEISSTLTGNGVNYTFPPCRMNEKEALKERLLDDRGMYIRLQSDNGSSNFDNLKIYGKRKDENG